MIGKFSTWQWDLNTNKIDYSDNQFRLLGFEPNSFVPSKETLLKYVHPDDKDAVPHLEEVKLPFVIVLWVVTPTGCVNREVDTLRVVVDHGGCIMYGTIA